MRAPAYISRRPRVDLNYLLSRHQISVMRGDAAASPEAGYAHKALAKLYAARINDLQQSSGAEMALARRA